MRGLATTHVGFQKSNNQILDLCLLYNHYLINKRLVNILDIISYFSHAFRTNILYSNISIVSK